MVVEHSECSCHAILRGSPMSDTTTWLPIGISALSLAVSGATLFLTERRNGRAETRQEEQEAELADLGTGQTSSDSQQIIQRLIIKWRNSHLNDPYAVTDDNWRALLGPGPRVAHRSTKEKAQTDLLAYTDTKTKARANPCFLLERTVEAAKAFERVVEPIVEAGGPPPEGMRAQIKTS